jgi:putative alpha-1,2-mannosidase
MEGNDDCGQMSAWYILSSLGFYPLDPTSGEYVIGSPLVKSATIRIGAPYAPKEFRIVTRNQSRTNARVKSVWLNGREIADRRLRHADIARGGTLEFEMAPLAAE